MSRGFDARIVTRPNANTTIEVDLEIGAGTTAALLGPNGAGKSTTVRALAGLTPISEGRISLGGDVFDDPATGEWVAPEDRRLGVVFQRYYLFEHLNVLDNVAFGLRVRPGGRARARRDARHWLEMFDLQTLAARRPSDLSGGEAQRVALARALAIGPAAVLLDEPMAALDLGIRAPLRRLLGERLSELEGPRLLITHDPADAFLLADEIHILEDGRITQRGTPDEIRRRPSTPYAAALAGVNLLTGVTSGGVIELDGHVFELRSSDTHTAGRVVVTIPPNAVALHEVEPHGSPRNTWPTTVAALEPLGDVVRVLLGTPLPLSVDITPGASAALALEPGRAIWASVKATEITVTPG